MTDVSAVIDGVIEREGGFVNVKQDNGGPTKFGITAATLGEWWDLGRPATADEVAHLSVADARAIYFARYVDEPGFRAIPHQTVLAVVVDDAVLSGPTTATQHLQAALGVKADGVIGPATRQALQHCDADAVVRGLVKARCLHYGRIVRDAPGQRVFLVGWLTRALSFL